MFSNNEPLVPMEEKELCEVLSSFGTKREDVVAAYKKGNTKIVLNGANIPTDEQAYQARLRDVECALETIYPNFKFSVTKKTERK